MREFNVRFEGITIATFSRHDIAGTKLIIFVPTGSLRDRLRSETGINSISSE